MPIYKLNASQTLTTDLQTAWQFFSNPANLAQITPPSMRFRLTGAPPAAIHAGLIITYRLSPLPFVPLEVSWATEITQVAAPHHFIDNQIAGPYALWHHKHRFREVGGGVLATDEVHYSLPADPLSKPAAELAVRPQLRTIFQYRAQALQAQFGEVPGTSTLFSIEPL